jgi:hypothetical protein
MHHARFRFGQLDLKKVAVVNYAPSAEAADISPLRDLRLEGHASTSLVR